MITAAAAGFQSALLLVISWILFQEARGSASARIKAGLPGRWPLVAFLLLLTGLSLAAGALIARAGFEALSLVVLPGLTIVILGAPIWAFSTWGAGGLNLGPRWRAAGIFGLGMTVAPLALVTIEVLIAIVMVAVAVIVVVAQPETVAELDRIARSLDSAQDPERIMQLVAPLVLRPGVIAAILAYIAVLVPMVEELVKPLGVWLFARRIESPAQGFGLGILCGAAYSLVEGLGVVGSGGPNWAAAVGVRAGTGLLHIATTGLMGWAIVSATREGRMLRLIATYVLAVMIHGLWNASAIVVALVAVANALGQPGLQTIGVSAAVAGMATLFAGMLTMLLAANRRLRQASKAAESDAAEGTSARGPA
jgi:hypothetical protein